MPALTKNPMKVHRFQLLSNFNITVLDGGDKPVQATVVRDTTLVTNGVPSIETFTNGRLDYDQAFRLRNWLSDWLGHHGKPGGRTTLG